MMATASTTKSRFENATMTLPPVTRPIATPRHAQDALIGARALKGYRHRKAFVRDRALPDFVATLALPHKCAPIGQQDFGHVPVKFGRHSCRDKIVVSDKAQAQVFARVGGHIQIGKIGGNILRSRNNRVIGFGLNHQPKIVIHGGKNPRVVVMGHQNIVINHGIRLCCAWAWDIIQTCTPCNPLTPATVSPRLDTQPQKTAVGIETPSTMWRLNRARKARFSYGQTYRGAARSTAPHGGSFNPMRLAASEIETSGGQLSKLNMWRSL